MPHLWIGNISVLWTHGVMVYLQMVIAQNDSLTRSQKRNSSGRRFK